MAVCSRTEFFRCNSAASEARASDEHVQLERVRHVTLTDDVARRQHLVLSFTDPLCCSSQLSGGKGAQLAQLTQLQSKQFIVPKGLPQSGAVTDCMNFPFPKMLPKIAATLFRILAQLSARVVSYPVIWALEV